MLAFGILYPVGMVLGVSSHPPLAFPPLFLKRLEQHY